MAGERYTDKAVKSIAEYLAATIPAQLDTIETEQGLTAGSMEDPVAYVTARVPRDNRSPLVEVFEVAWDFVNQRERLMAVDCSIAFSFACDADLEAGYAKLRRYETAILKVLEASPSLSSRVVAALPTDGAAGTTRGDDSSTRLVFVQGVLVHVHDQG
jgi:hypothetical protein